MLPTANDNARLPPLPPPPEPPIGQPSEPEEISPAKATVTFYYSPYCPYSSRLRPILDSLKEKYENDSVAWAYVDVTTEEGFAAFDSMLREKGLSAAYRAVPFVTIGKEKFIGIGETSTKIEAYLDSLL
jgi:glutaredoxin